MEVICLEDQTFYQLIDLVVERIKDKYGIKKDRWISGEEVMKQLGITSKTTLQRLRNEGKIRFSQPEKKIILYDQTSVDLYLEKYAHETF